METTSAPFSPPTSARAPRAVMTIERLVEKHELAKAKKRASSSRRYATDTAHAARKKAMAMARYHAARPLARYNTPTDTRLNGRDSAGPPE